MGSSFAGRRLAALLALGFSLGWGARARASSLAVNPVQVRLHPGATSTLLQMRNAGDASARYELSAFAWKESPFGEMELQPTRDVLFFPPIFALGPGEARNVRVGATVAFGPVERTYRLIVQELPPPQAAPASSGVNLLSRFVIPVFVSPTAPAASKRIEKLELVEHRFVFHLRNTGNVHVRPRTIVAEARGGEGERLFGRTWDGWYVLAGTERIYAVDIPERSCGRVRALSVEVQDADRVLREELRTPKGACR